ncbi:hypothetical protein SAMN04488069_1126 [Hymenobacter psychrophilus]|uniref:Uncharacterized protein n=1 Tax=Hymenobacter psychrophilus TaxID=651662 RepID=A0A1H3M2H5_9BACT|nr:hypothetical protein SAMN04488069_1126 [Hymenobacter psychrophilus]
MLQKAVGSFARHNATESHSLRYLSRRRTRVPGLITGAACSIPERFAGAGGARGAGATAVGSQNRPATTRVGGAAAAAKLGHGASCHRRAGLCPTGGKTLAMTAGGMPLAAGQPASAAGSAGKPGGTGATLAGAGCCLGADAGTWCRSGRDAAKTAVAGMGYRRRRCAATRGHGGAAAAGTAHPAAGGGVRCAGRNAGGVILVAKVCENVVGCGAHRRRPPLNAAIKWALKSLNSPLQRRAGTSPAPYYVAILATAKLLPNK